MGRPTREQLQSDIKECTKAISLHTKQGNMDNVLRYEFLRDMARRVLKKLNEESRASSSNSEEVEKI